jgi:hypothetical protein
MATLGDLYYERPALSDVWTNEQYTTSESTTRDGLFDGNFQGLLEIGATAIEGLVFVGKYYCTTIPVVYDVCVCALCPPVVVPIPLDKN